MKHSFWFLICTSFCLGCSSPSNWQLTSIPTGQKKFDTARLCYTAPDSLAGIHLDFFWSNGTISAYLSTLGRRINLENQTKASIAFKSEILEIPIVLHEGSMRLRLSDELTTKTAQALQEGEEVTIIIGTIRQTFLPENFSTLFHQLTQTSNNFFDSFQGIMP